ncbi:MAG: T9SS type A sorting domain-containing protein, partial [Ignavibacteria bacterium]|nr:T9SS type A sorting domain-containing protein [Ignavibacteria bacterium]
DEASSISTDANGNVYVVGYFQSYTLIFNNGISLAKSGDLDGYIAKYNSDGICQWAEKIAGTNIEYARSISTDANANIYVAGYFKSSTLTFNNDIELLNSGSNDAFIARYNSDGMCQWAEKVAGTNVDNASSVSTDVNGNVYVTGDFFSDTLTFNNGITLSNSGGRRYSFIAKYNSDGICQWAERVAGGTDNDNTTSISTDANIYVAGNSWLDTPTFSNGITVSNSSNWDGFIAKYTDSETHVNPQLSFSSNNGIDQPLFLSPNPVKDNILNIAFNLLTPEQVTIEIANMLGELVSVVKSNELFPQGEHSSNVDISNLPAGAYFCILRFKDKFYQQKFIRY